MLLESRSWQFQCYTDIPDNHCNTCVNSELCCDAHRPLWSIDIPGLPDLQQNPFMNAAAADEWDRQTVTVPLHKIVSRTSINIVGNVGILISLQTARYSNVTMTSLFRSWFRAFKTCVRVQILISEKYWYHSNKQALKLQIKTYF